MLLLDPGTVHTAPARVEFKQAGTTFSLPGLVP